MIKAEVMKLPVYKSNPPTVGDVLTPVTITVNLYDPLARTRMQFRRHHIRQLAVMHEGNLAGLIREKDVWLMPGPDFDYPRESELLVEDAFIQDPLIVDIEYSLIDTLFLLAEHRCECALVTKNGKLAEIFSDTDACRCFGTFLQLTSLTGRP